MSTRVQKGGPVFRPIAKPRARPASETRQTPLSSEPRKSATPSVGHVTNATGSMPPPSTIPGSHTSSELPVTALGPSLFPTDFEEEGSSGASSSTFFIPMPSRNTSRPPTVIASPAPPPVRHSSSGPAVSIGVPSRSALPTSRASLEQPITKPIIPVDNSTDIRMTYSEPSTILSNDLITTQTSSITDAQIDPALLEAVVTALRDANQNQAPPPELAPPAGPSMALNSDSHVRPQRRRVSGRPSQEDTTTDVMVHDIPSPKAKRARRRSSNGDAQTADGDSPSSERQRKRRARAPSLPPYDPEADPGEELDPTAVTMAQLCDDMGRGKVSSKAAQIVSNHATWRTSNREKRARMRAIMEAKKFGRNLEDEEDGANTQSSANDQQPPAERASSTTPSVAGPSSQVDPENDEEQRGDDFDYTRSMATSRYNVQVRIGPNGETIIDETSLFVDRQEEDETANYTHIEESDTSKFVNSSSYSKKLRGSRWSAEETELFYDALSQFGENYELISYVLPGRDRKACKNKFKAEDRRNPSRITYCLKNRRPVDLQTLSRMTGKDFSGPTPIIRAPTPLNVPEDSHPPNPAAASAGSQARVKIRKKSKTPALDGVEIIGLVEDQVEHSDS